MEASAQGSIELQEKKLSRRLKVAFAVLLGLAVVGVAAYLLVFKSEEEKVLFTTFGYSKPITVRALTNNGAEQRPVSISGTLLDYAQNGNHKVALTQDADGSYQVQLLGDDQRIIASGTDKKAAVAVAASGQAVAYATYTGNRNPELFSPFLDEWEIRLVYIGSNEIYQLGDGFAPEFFTRNGVEYLMFTSPEGITIMDLGAKTSYGIPFPTQNVVDSAATIRADGAYIASRNIFTNRFTVFSVSEVNDVMTLSAVGQVGDGALLNDVAWKEDLLHAVNPPTQDGAGSILFFSIDPAQPTTLNALGEIDSSEQLRLISS